MIYLLKTAGLDMHDNPITILKIGYTDDSRGNKRFKDYRVSGLDIRIIKQVPGGSIDIEHKLQRRFSKYRLPWRRGIEWFYFEKSIIDAFNKFNNDLDILNYLGYSNFREYAQSLISTPKEILISETLRKMACDGNNMEAINFFLKFADLTSFTKRMKLVCQCNDLKILEVVFKYLTPIGDSRYQTYFEALGPEKCKALKYRAYNLKQEYDRLLSNQKIDIRDKILERFNIGSKYSLVDIKKKLSELYKEVGYTAVPKATILKKYFELRPVKFTVKLDDGRSEKVNGFEILSIKENI